MTITNHYLDQNGDLYFTIETPEFDIKEEVIAEQMISSDPNAIRLYQYLSKADLRYIAKTKHDTGNLLHIKLHGMILEYISVGHYEAAMDIIETAFVSKRRPSSQIIMALVDIMLQPKNERKGSQKSKYNVRQRSKGFPSNSDEENDEDDLSGTGFAEFEDFWDLMDRCLAMETRMDITAKARRMALDFLISVLEFDMRSKKGTESP
ncbi:hypothetical protein EC973_004070 [Apophysomyces ossiformis]|uniref:Uncharacterized protein n=1 Tax=Apophysomyces ossiformis TaxID=679940 RepID=A0A8H7EM00_9FUNG|nr:hypothetical protein EC973_004070 [Apophysomyces ossiformis]